MDGNELVIGSFLNVRGDFTRNRQVENFLTFFVSEGDDHKFVILIFAYYASRNFLNLRIRSRLVNEKILDLIISICYPYSQMDVETASLAHPSSEGSLSDLDWRKILRDIYDGKMIFVVFPEHI
jgi:hypothetical protein